MGMFDKPKYLTGAQDAFVSPGGTFWLHNARLDGTATLGGATRDQAKLLVSHERDGAQVVVYTSGVAIVNQIKRMDGDDRAAMPIELRLDSIPATQAGRNPTNVLTPASEPPPASDGFAGATGSDF
jgi:hypothetical protein